MFCTTERRGKNTDVSVRVRLLYKAKIPLIAKKCPVMQFIDVGGGALMSCDFIIHGHQGTAHFIYKVRKERKKWIPVVSRIN